jgi:hypothetical protein
VGGIPLDGLHEVADEVVPPFELDVDLGPGLLDEVAELDEAVVGAEEPEDEPQDDDAEDDERDGHARLPCCRCVPILSETELR